MRTDDGGMYRAIVISQRHLDGATEIKVCDRSVVNNTRSAGGIGLADLDKKRLHSVLLLLMSSGAHLNRERVVFINTGRSGMDDNRCCAVATLSSDNVAG
jgi:hypothetical protein